MVRLQCHCCFDTCVSRSTPRPQFLHITVLSRINPKIIPHLNRELSSVSYYNPGLVMCCCKYASAVCYSLWLYHGVLPEDHMDRVSGRSLTETSTLEMAVDRRRRPSTAGGGRIP
jgi:hypothetical protein